MLTSTTSRGPARSSAPTMRIARATTQRSIAAIRSKRSATGRNADGAISSPSAPRMRSSSSYWVASPVARSTIGCACSTKRSSASASRIMSAHEMRASIRVSGRSGAS